VRAAYRRWFLEHEEAGSEGSNAACLHEIGQDPRRVLERAASAETSNAYDAATAEARGLGIFGVPTFAAGDEIFWGDDRLEDAIRWRQQA
jgi:2-hydroxychromene-2-carboxylate isomerase